NGPFVTKPVRIVRSGLTIRAAEGFRPSLVLDSVGEDALIETDASLVVEGLELRDQRGGGAPDPVLGLGPSLHPLPCRFLLLSPAQSVSCRCPILVARNCEFLSSNSDQGIVWHVSTGDKCLIENCLLTGNSPLYLGAHHFDRESIHLSRNTFLAG